MAQQAPYAPDHMAPLGGTSLASMGTVSCVALGFRSLPFAVQTSFLRGCLETSAKRMEQYEWPVAVGKLGLFYYFSAYWDLWLQVKVI